MEKECKRGSKWLTLRRQMDQMKLRNSCSLLSAKWDEIKGSRSFAIHNSNSYSGSRMDEKEYLKSLNNEKGWENGNGTLWNRAPGGYVQLISWLILQKGEDELKSATKWRGGKIEREERMRQVIKHERRGWREWRMENGEGERESVVSVCVCL